MATIAGSAKLALGVLLAGAVLQSLVGLLLIGFAAYSLGWFGNDPTLPTWFGLAQLVFGLVALVGGEVGLRAYRKGRLGDLEAAFLRGIVASLLPPVSIVTLVGAVLCRVAATASSTPARKDENPFLR